MVARIAPSNGTLKSLGSLETHKRVLMNFCYSIIHQVKVHSLSDSDLISVVVPAFNSESFRLITFAQIIRSLESLGNPFELVIVNDGSSDSTWRVLQQ